MSAFRISIVAAMLVLVSPVAWSDTVSLPLTDDAWIHAASPDINYGNTGSMLVSSWGRKRALVRFDAAIISGQPVNSATLKLYLSNVRTSGNISIHPITSSWSESSVTWLTRPPVTMDPVAIATLSRSDVGSVISVDVTEAVQRWADGSLPDAGVLIETAIGLEAYFTTKEGAASGTAPTLAVETVEEDLSWPDGPCYDNFNRYVDCGNGTVTDTVTGLVWTKDAGCIPPVTFARANNVAANLQHGTCGLTDNSRPGDWRLPSRSEWAATIEEAVRLGCTLGASGNVPSLTDKTGRVCFSLGEQQFENVDAARTALYWSSTTRADSPRYAYAWLTNGSANGGSPRHYLVQAWAVRDGR